MHTLTINTPIEHCSIAISDAAPGKSLTKEQRQNRVLEWQQLKQEENVRLQEESKTFSDVLFVPNVDVYRNLPSQLLGFYRWYENHNWACFCLVGRGGWEGLEGWGCYVPCTWVGSRHSIGNASLNAKMSTIQGGDFWPNPILSRIVFFQQPQTTAQMASINFVFTGLQKLCHFPSHSKQMMTVLWI